MAEADNVQVRPGAARPDGAPGGGGFPRDFVWGAATAAYQIEGAAREDGRGDSVWDAFCRRAGNVEHGHTGDVACDHYRRWADDIAIMRDLGLRAYRFSISWPRVLPDGTGRVNEAGLSFYERLVDGLLEAGIEPYATLFHWDYPTSLLCRGGWLSPESPGWFAEYASVVARRLGDRVTSWMTLNEPQVFMALGHEQGEHAPGLRLPADLLLRAVHHVLLGHGRAVLALREHAARTPRVGWAPVGSCAYPDSDRPEDIAAARELTFSIGDLLGHGSGAFSNTLYADPVCLGRYPEEIGRLHGSAAVRPAPGEMELINQPLDFFGFNLYFGVRVRAGANGRAEVVEYPTTSPRTTMGWPVTPEALGWCARFHHERYGLPLYVTENGRACDDVADDDGRVRDTARTSYLRGYLRSLRDAIAAGADVRGYFCWSLLDNFEWARGYTQRFGLVRVDYATGERTIKDSGRWYRGVIGSNGASLDAPLA